MGKRKIDFKEPPEKEEVEGLGNRIWGKEKEFNRESEWIKREEESMNETGEQDWEAIDTVPCRTEKFR